MSDDDIDPDLERRVLQELADAMSIVNSHIANMQTAAGALGIPGLILFYMLRRVSENFYEAYGEETGDPEMVAKMEAFLEFAVDIRTEDRANG